MAHHKRRRPKHRRAGCLLCKPYKDERCGGRENETPSVRRRLQDDLHVEAQTYKDAA